MSIRHRVNAWNTNGELEHGDDGRENPDPQWHVRPEEHDEVGNDEDSEGRSPGPEMMEFARTMA
ncbi:hypothetical protein KX816_15795 [Sphingosinicellaceae bacterium]|nr:hypothetical protein KX816_15795 [Sphingosinicellaceae bacterium]